MYKNTEHITPIVAFGADGEGIAKPCGFTVFVPSAVKGDLARILIVKEKKNYGYGKLLEVIEPSPLRAAPECESFPKCGGCTMQSISYEHQLEYKKNKVADALTRIGNFEDPCILSVTGSNPCYHYRNKAQFPVTLAFGKVQAGFYAPHSHRVIPTEECALQDKRTNAVVNAVCNWANTYAISVYDEESGKGLLRRICMRCGKSEAVLVLVASKDLPFKEELIEKITGEFPFVKGIVINFNKKITNNVYGECDEVIYGKPCIIDNVGDVKYKVHYKSFYQVNPYTTEKLYNKALELANCDKSGTVFDLYCGTGSISLFLAKKAKKVIGIEIVEDAVKNARENAELNEIKNTEFYCGAAEEVAPKLMNEGTRADVVVLDPPRKGCDEKLLTAISKMAPERIVYVSCDCATMARDAKFLAGNGYKLMETHIFDQFPQTSHVESVALLVRTD